MRLQLEIMRAAEDTRVTLISLRFYFTLREVIRFIGLYLIYAPR